MIRLPSRLLIACVAISLAIVTVVLCSPSESITPAPAYVSHSRTSPTKPIIPRNLAREQREQLDRLFAGFPARRREAEPTKPVTPPRNVMTDPRLAQIARTAEFSFNSRDRNGDGVLNFDELSETLKREKAKHDINRDGVISRTEYVDFLKGYYASRLAAIPRIDRRPSTSRLRKRSPSKKPSNAKKEADDSPYAELDEKPIVHRWGAYPEEMPEWFSTLDENRDSQISLAEWKSGNVGALKKFQFYDRNGDALLTPEEMLFSLNKDDESAEVLPDPGSLQKYARQAGKSFYFRVTARRYGSIWGTDDYTTDSRLAQVVIHAGLLKEGETGVVKVTILSGAESFQGSTRNGVTSRNWNRYPSAYRVRRSGKQSSEPQPEKYAKLMPKWYKSADENRDSQISLFEWKKSKVGSVAIFQSFDFNDDALLTSWEILYKLGVRENGPEVLPDPGNLRNYAKQPGKTFLFSVTARKSGSVWGTSTYTTDSRLSVVVIHAGLLREGETGIVKVTILPGASSFQGSNRNGVTTRNWRGYPSAYRVARYRGSR